MNHKQTRMAPPRPGEIRVVLELRPGEGGEDARSLCDTMARIYLKHAERSGFAASVEDRGWL